MTARERLYERAPRWLQSALVTAYGLKLVGLRRGPHYWRWSRFLERSAEWPRDRLEAYQLERLRALVEHARRLSPFYRERIGAPIRSLDELRRLPPVDKETFRRELPRIRTIERGVPVHTGGTTGKPLTVLFTRRDLQERMATLDSWRKRHGAGPWSSRATFSGRIVVPPSGVAAGIARTNLALRQRLYSTFHLHESRLDEYARDLERFQPQMIDGFPSAIALVAGHLVSTGIAGRVRPRAVFTTSENLYPHQRRLIALAFACQPRDQYASAEGAPFVTECERGSLHYDLRTGVIEQGEGGILVTSFTTSGTPLIRYRIGDRMDLTEGHCECGNHNPVISSIDGREQDYIVSPDRGAVGVGLIDIFKKIPPVVKQAQVDQVGPDELLVRLVPDSSAFEEKYLDTLREGLVERVGRSMRIGFAMVERIAPEPGGKVRYVKRSWEAPGGAEDRA